MDPSYETVVDPVAMVGAGIGALIHVGLLAAQIGLAIFLVASGIHGLVFPDRDGKWLRRLGATHPGHSKAHLVFAFLTNKPGDRWKTPRTNALVAAAYEALGG